MKKLLSLLAITAICICTINAQDNEHRQIEASGKIITKEVSVQSFDQLEVSGLFNVLLSQGSKEEVKIEADDNLQPFFEVKNDGSKLVITMKKDLNIKGKTRMNVYVTFRTLKSMALKTVGNVTSDKSLSFENLKISNKSVGSIDLKLTTQTLDVQNKSVGNVTLDGKAENAVIKNNGVGSFLAAGFIVQKMDIENSGVGSAEVNAAKELKVKDSILGRVTNKGAASPRKMNKVTI